MESNQPEGRKCKKCDIISVATRRSNSEKNKDREYYYCPSDYCKNSAGFFNFLGWADEPEESNKPFKKRKPDYPVKTRPVNNVPNGEEVVNIVQDIQSIVKKMQEDNDQNWKDVVSILHEQTLALKEMEPVIKKAIVALERLSK